MSDYTKDLERFLDAWEQVQRDMAAQERVDELASQIGIPAKELLENFEQISKLVRRIGKVVTRRDLVDLTFDAREAQRKKDDSKSGADSN